MTHLSVPEATKLFGMCRANVAYHFKAGHIYAVELRHLNNQENQPPL